VPEIRSEARICCGGTPRIAFARQTSDTSWLTFWLLRRPHVSVKFYIDIFSSIDLWIMIDQIFSLPASVDSDLLGVSRLAGGQGFDFGGISCDR